VLVPSRAAYDKRKYMWKLLYTRMLGYDVDFGQKQAMDLIAAPGYVFSPQAKGPASRSTLCLTELDPFLKSKHTYTLQSLLDA